MSGKHEGHKTACCYCPLQANKCPLPHVQDVGAMSIWKLSISTSVLQNPVAINNSRVLGFSSPTHHSFSSIRMRSLARFSLCVFVVGLANQRRCVHAIDNPDGDWQTVHIWSRFSVFLRPLMRGAFVSGTAPLLLLLLYLIHGFLPPLELCKL